MPGVVPLATGGVLTKLIAASAIDGAKPVIRAMPRPMVESSFFMFILCFELREVRY